MGIPSDAGILGILTYWDIEIFPVGIRYGDIGKGAKSHGSSQSCDCENTASHRDGSSSTFVHVLQASEFPVDHISVGNWGGASNNKWDIMGYQWDINGISWDINGELDSQTSVEFLSHQSEFCLVLLRRDE